MCSSDLSPAGRGQPVIIVLNDNGRSYAPTVGGLSDHLAHLRSTPEPVGNMFECLGLGYVGPVDGHDVAAVERALRAARELGRSVVVHCVTEKGRGHRPAERHEGDRMQVVRAAGPAVTPVRPTWTSVFGREMVALGAERSDIVAVIAAMVEPVGLDEFATAFPARVFDVGIAEQHTVTSAAGLAMAAMHPVVAVYAT